MNITSTEMVETERVKGWEAEMEAVEGGHEGDKWRAGR
jgi:hypothetical protein